MSKKVSKTRENVYYTSPQSFLICWLNKYMNFYWILIGWLIKLSLLTFQPPIVLYNRGNFVYYHWGCMLIYQPLSYPFRSLISRNNKLDIPIVDIQNYPFCSLNYWLKSLDTYSLQGSKGIRQWMIKLCTSTIMLNKDTPSVDYN